MKDTYQRWFNYKIALKGIIAPLMLVVTWQVGSYTGFLPMSIISPPISAFTNFFKLLFNGDFALNFFESITRLVGGLFIGSSLGIIIGTIVGYKRTIATYIEPLLLILVPVPPLAWIPVLIIFFGTDEGVKISLIAYGCFATMFLSTSLQAKNVDNEYLDVCKILKKSEYDILTEVVLPFCLPTIFSSLRVAMALSWTLLMASEMIKSSSGLGWFINDSRNFSRADDLTAGIIFIGLIGKLTDLLIVTMGNYFTDWQNKAVNNG